MSPSFGRAMMPQSIIGMVPWVSYKLMQRICVLDITRLLWLDGRTVPVQKWTRGDYSIRLLSSQAVARYSRLPDCEFDASAMIRMASGRHYCCAAEDRQGLAAYVWLALESIEAEHNRGAHPSSGVAISFPSDTAFIYQAFTRPDLRGQELFPACVNAAREALHPSGVINLLSTTDWTNRPARRSFKRMGFRELGLVWRFGWEQKMFTVVPPAASVLNLRFNPPDRQTASIAVPEKQEIKFHAPSVIYPGAKPICQLPLRDSSFRQRWD